jgi:hypothetical protein
MPLGPRPWTIVEGNMRGPLCEGLSLSSRAGYTNTGHLHFLVRAGHEFASLCTLLAFVWHICIRERLSSRDELIADTFVGWSAYLSIWKQRSKHGRMELSPSQF